VTRAGTGVDPDPPTGLLQDLLECSPFGVLACDGRGVVRSANPAARRMLPAAEAGAPLPGAPDPAAGDVELEQGGRVLAAHPVALPDGWTAWHLLDVTDDRARLDALIAERATARFLSAATGRLGRSRHPGRTARAAAELGAELVDAAVVVLAPVTGAVEWVRCAGGQVDTGWELVTRMPDAVRAALRGFAVAPGPLLAVELTGEPWTGAGPIGSAEVVALPGEVEPAGVLVLIQSAARAPADRPSADLVVGLADRAGRALTTAALQAQRTLAARVLERAVFEARLPDVDGVVLAAAHRPADLGLLVGGDFYDVRADPAGGAELLVGDVVGKGADAALTAGQIRQSVRTLRWTQPDPIRLLEQLNAILLDAVAADQDPRFATMVLGRVDPRPGGGVRLRLAGGGHPPPLVVRSTGVEMVGIGGTLVGALQPPRFDLRIVDLAPGESCVLYTDGIVEARGGPDGRQLLGEERLAELLEGCHILPAPGVVDRILDRTTRWLADRGHDDMAVLVVQAPRHPAPTRRAHLRVVETPVVETPVFETEEEPHRRGRTRR
jgi:serine phosphatase RsbU (regulator of sigma subunit)